MPQNYVLLETIVLGQNSASVTFDNIPQTGYTDLKIVGSARSTYSGGYVAMRLNPNGSTSNASSSIVYGSGTSVAAFSDTIIYATINANNATSNTFGNFEIYCPNYTVSATKTFSVDAVTEDNASTALTLFAGSRWDSNSAITSLYLAPTVGDFMANSTFSLYGVADTGATPVISPFATGGNIVANDGTYWYHAFLSSGTFAPLKNLSCDYLLVAGGGAGGGQIGGGGGAGGLRYLTQSLVGNTTYPAIVGAGGAGINAVQTESGNGTNSSFAGNSATGGGGGGGNGGDFAGGKNGGSSGGAGESNASFSGNAGGYTPVEGYAGGNAFNTPNYGSGGGGGAGGNGASGTGSAGGNGGVGVNTYSAFATATNTGVSGYYAGGGGGSIIGATQGSGGSGGGGRGGNFENIVQPQSGTANTGGGGGGQASNSASFPSGSGGSGIVIVRYPMAS